MGLFGFGAKASVDKSVVGFLKDVDVVYTKALLVKQPAMLEKYMTRSCLIKQAEKIRVGERAYAGLERYKHVTWKHVSSDATTFVYNKEVTYDDIKMSHGIVVPVGDSCNERWTVILEDDKYKVSEIRRL